MTYKKTAVAATLALGAAAALFFFRDSVRGAVYGWNQTSWSGGASTTALARHPGDESGWTKYYSKDATVTTATPGQAGLSTTTGTWTQTTTADFNAGTKTNTYATSGTAFLRKPAGVACAAGAECATGYCGSITRTCSACGSVDYGGETYETIQIGEQCWLARNLNIGNYATSTNTGSDHTDVSNNGIVEKYCYSNSTANCTTDGGLYDWNEAMGYVTTENVQGICPTGWHIPSDAQWYQLENYLKDAGQTCSASRNGAWDCATAGTKLKSGGSSGFAALLAGLRYYTGSFFNRSSYAYFWSSSQNSASNAWYRSLYSSNVTVYRNNNGKTYGFSVRCLKD
jgi:uncharacterized protein (TIGR02145 family)